ncbi:hypothetical protein BV900_13115 [Agrobacterium tumefaciens]|uniref:Uncharacterized protein n=1 Tax=Agrobacterium tumefaciens TaxID=358 RepID=A0AB36EM63_AGRTU|nr:hypothetical protein A6U91_24270 [Agrobacterium tumefaciens]OMP71875.1 hypothetical protein BV900_13115 [Agrobacterium tumefaciens]
MFLFPHAYLKRAHRIILRPAIPDAREISSSPEKRIDFDQMGLALLCGEQGNVERVGAAYLFSPAWIRS